jgi:predicted AAA+ superfamily ATPase
VSKKKTDFQRPQAAVLAEPRRFVQVVAGPRQVGKSTLVQQVTAELDVPVRYVSADEPSPSRISRQRVGRYRIAGRHHKQTVARRES